MYLFGCFIENKTAKLFGKSSGRYLMELFTRSYDKEWNRIVHLLVKRQDDLRSYINDSSTCKLVLVKAGNGVILCNNKKIHVIAPALLFFNHEDKVESMKLNDIECDIIYFKPEVINDKLQYDVLTGKVNQEDSITTVHDRFLLNDFYTYGKESPKIMLLQADALLAIQQLYRNIERELLEQRDGFWPCRSRSFFLELLFYIDRIRQTNTKDSDITPLMLSQKETFETVRMILAYMNENISNKITVSELTKKFGINRNRLNEMFNETTGKTAMQCLLQMRINLAALMLKNTELPIEEITYRVGFNDVSYFTKTFRTYFKLTPSQYRKEAV